MATVGCSQRSHFPSNFELFWDRNGGKKTKRAKREHKSKETLSSLLLSLLPGPRFVEVCATEALTTKPNSQILLPFPLFAGPRFGGGEDPVSFARTGDGRLLRFDSVGLGAQVRSVGARPNGVQRSSFSFPFLIFFYFNLSWGSLLLFGS